MGCYMVLCCKYCGMWNVKWFWASPSTLKCKYCRKSMRVSINKKCNRTMKKRGPYFYPLQAAEVCKQLNINGHIGKV